jgi:catechol 2,3-dioxygenase-like lactoylglutathione lyase family enzyme
MPASIRHVLTVLAFDDLPRAAAFYRAAFGWEVAVEAPGYVEFSMPDGMRLGLYQREAFGRNTGQVPVAVPPGALSTAELYLQADDLVAAVAALEGAGARCLSPAVLRDWGDQVAYFADPEGHVLALAGPRGG